MRVAIIGTAGRKDDANKLSRDTFLEMVHVAREYVNELRKIDDVIVAVSGGAAWADHVAVSLFLSGHVEELELNLPCKFDMKQKCFQDNGSRNFRDNPGGVANYYHNQFSTKMGGNTLDGIYRAIRKGAIVYARNGFKDRNKKVAVSHHMLAFTFGEGDIPKEGGTKHTWDSAPEWCKKKHVSLEKL